jgi:uncharacterized membrane protein
VVEGEGVEDLAELEGGGLWSGLGGGSGWGGGGRWWVIWGGWEWEVFFFFIVVFVVIIIIVLVLFFLVIPFVILSITKHTHWKKNPINQCQLKSELKTKEEENSQERKENKKDKNSQTLPLKKTLWTLVRFFHHPPSSFPHSVPNSLDFPFPSRSPGVKVGVRVVESQVLKRKTKSSRQIHRSGW